MLSKIHISNFLLIDKLDLVLEDGLTTITGETGAGKSIILGALGLALGNRAELSQIKRNDKKCIIEVAFESRHPKVIDFFKREDFDVDDQILLRREISVQGKSRSFINDTPATLSQLKELGSFLIYLHSQFANQELKDKNFQFFLLDVFSKNEKLDAEYKACYKSYKNLCTEIYILEEQRAKSKLDVDYHSFLLNEIDELNPQPGELEQKEEELNKKAHAEEILLSLNNVEYLLSNDSVNMLSQFNQISQLLGSVSSFSSSLQDLSKRMDSLRIELEDISQEVSITKNDLSVDEEGLEILRSRIDLFKQLLYKHQLNTSAELLQKQAELKSKVQGVEKGEELLEELYADRDRRQKELELLANKLSESRQKKAPILAKEIDLRLEQLGMSSAKTIVELTRNRELSIHGLDSIKMLFSANKGKEAGELNKNASGGEISRFMLAVKSILSSAVELPTIIFDEIDTGISGEMANRMGNIMKSISKNLQIVAITHLPQIAAKGKSHLCVIKNEKYNKVVTEVKKLNKEERILELAKMLSGDQISGAAKENARTLLNN